MEGRHHVARSMMDQIEEKEEEEKKKKVDYDKSSRTGSWGVLTIQKA